MHPHAALVTRLYTSFQRLDATGMATCYHPEATFSDPVFQALSGPQVPAMWRMLAGRAKDFELTFSDVKADDELGSARWEARYTFAKTGRRVHNRIRSDFTFRDGLIVRQVDEFDLYAWTRMALGPMGTLLGWTPLVQKKVRREAMDGLARSMGS